MKLSTRSRYGVRIMLDLALNQKSSERPLDVKTMADREGLSEKYLGQILIPLKAADLVQSVQGKKGGYFLAMDAKDITVLDIVKILETTIQPVPCSDDKTNCERYSDCGVQAVWSALNNAIKTTLSSFTLEDLVNEAENGMNQQIVYSI